jgi:MFS family permease
MRLLGWLRRAVPGTTRPVALFMLHSVVLNIGYFGISDLLVNFYFVSLGYSPETIGTLQGVSRVGGFVTGLLAGMLTDRLGVRWMTILMVLALMVGASVMIVFPALPALYLSRFLSGAFYGASFIASTPFIVRLTEERQQVYLFSYYGVVTMVGTALGSVVGGHIPALMASLLLPEMADRIAAAGTPTAYGAALLLGNLITGLSVLPLLWLRLPALPTTSTPAPDLMTGARLRIPWPRLTYLVSPFFIFGITAGLTFPFYNLFFRDTFTLPDPDVGTILSFGWLGMGLIMFILPPLDRRLGGAKALALTMTVAAAAFLLLSATPGLNLSVILFVIAISVRNTMTPLFNPLVMKRLPHEFHSSASSLGTVMWSLGWFVATSLGGVWQQVHGYPYILRMAAAGVFLTGLNIWAVFRARPSPPSPES